VVKKMEHTEVQKFPKMCSCLESGLDVKMPCMEQVDDLRILEHDSSQSFIIPYLFINANF
jgi:hypothetical protein